MMFLLGFVAGILAFLAFYVVMSCIKAYKLKKDFKKAFISAFPKGEVLYKRKKRKEIIE